MRAMKVRPRLDGFASRLTREIRSFGNMSKFSRACGIPMSNISSWCAGKSEPCLYHTLLLARATGRSPNWLLTGENDWPPHGFGAGPEGAD